MILIIALAMFFLFYNKGMADTEVITVTKIIQPVAVVKVDIEEKIKDELPDVFVDIAKAESRLYPKAVNWNCMYGEKSKPCKKIDREKAWSVDCGLFQINQKGNKCPIELFDIDINISITKDLYEHRGLQPWKSSLEHWS